MQPKSFSTTDIVEFYNETAWEYRFFWSEVNLHYGFYDDAHTSHREAMTNSNSVYADKLDADETDTILDIGTGRGGLPIHIAAERDADVHGIDIDPSHIRDARANARERDVAESTAFGVGTYHEIPYPDDTFDAVSGIETVCHSAQKDRVLEEIRRVLVPGGRVLLSDGYMSRTALTAPEKETVRTVLDGWAVPELAHVGEFRTALEAAGFTNVTFDDHYDRIMPSSRRQRWLSRAVTPLLRAASALGVKSDSSVKQGVTLYHQYDVLDRGLAVHGDFTAELPA
ncbi:methyltransferase domain-containing protein [Natrialba asiatica]|uniref:UbiE/COQ5 family methyltransferase n=1 Tax=Natrialba asiatica (strain ATCC 700177 / DSM 12278 / JCM 9576 / FERM P-10747 / NBRC 102637 / 172P1) TaxID=29540 RepID=M0AWC8_NATA1|nr:methyltransferase domain-containing protein [Natrialba asiatica]ELZ02840.1 UbiE/COQ5 family methyltransferase [Natrialba asiatica DSM 12278]